MPDELNLRTPPEFSATLRWLAEVETDAFDSALQVLQGDTYHHLTVLNELGSLHGWDDGHARDVIGMLESLSDVKRVLRVSRRSLADSVSRAVGGEPSQAAVLADRLDLLLSSRVMRFISRGRDLAGEREHILDDARIITDIRPMFTPPRAEDVTGLDGAIITHSLRLRYSGAAEPTLHIALDNAHLRDLQYEIKRALNKSALLEHLIEEKLDVPYIEPGGDISAEQETDGGSE